MTKSNYKKTQDISIKRTMIHSCRKKLRKVADENQKDQQDQHCYYCVAYKFVGGESSAHRLEGFDRPVHVVVCGQKRVSGPQYLLSLGTQVVEDVSADGLGLYRDSLAVS